MSCLVYFPQQDTNKTPPKHQPASSRLASPYPPPVSVTLPQPTAQAVCLSYIVASLFGSPRLALSCVILLGVLCCLSGWVGSGRWTEFFALCLVSAVGVFFFFLSSFLWCLSPPGLGLSCLVLSWSRATCSVCGFPPQSPSLFFVPGSLSRHVGVTWVVMMTGLG